MPRIAPAFSTRGFFARRRAVRIAVGRNAGKLYVGYFVAMNWKNTGTTIAQTSRKRVRVSITGRTRHARQMPSGRAKLHGNIPRK